MDRYLLQGNLQEAAASDQGEQRQLQEARHGARDPRSRAPSFWTGFKPSGGGRGKGTLTSPQEAKKAKVVTDLLILDEICKQMRRFGNNERNTWHTFNQSVFIHH